MREHVDSPSEVATAVTSYHQQSSFQIYLQRTSPHMHIRKHALWPTGLCHEIMRRQTGRQTRDIVVKKHRVLNRHGPKTGISNIRTVNSSMQHHRAGHRHNRTDSPLSNIITVVCTGTSTGGNLFERFQMLRKTFGSESRTNVSNLLLGITT